MTPRRKISLIFIGIALMVGAFFYAYERTYLRPGSNDTPQTITIEKGDNAFVVGEKLSKSKVISGKFFLALYLWKSGKIHSIIAGTYEFSPGLKIPEVSRIITGGEVKTQRTKITIPEGWDTRQIAERLKSNGFSDVDFLAIVKSPSQNIIDLFPFLRQIPKGKTLEGFLFPDTYYFAKDATAEEIIIKMLKNFSQKVSQNMIKDASDKNRSLYEIVTMASIIEGEVRGDDDRRVVAGIFWNRIAAGQALQSCATLAYILGENKKQYSLADTQVKSPYNTYQNRGLPPGPISNPGLSTITAAIYPQDSDYNYFLSDPETGKTVFSRTFEEHVANKSKYGLWF